MEIFNLAFYSKGGFPYDSVISLPVKRRKQYLLIMLKAYEQLKKEMLDASSGQTVGKSRLITKLDTLFIKKMYLTKRI